MTVNLYEILITHVQVYSDHAMNLFAFTMNLIGLLISFYVFIVTRELQHRYGLKNTKFFVFGSIGIVVWNFSQLLLMILPEDRYSLAWSMMVINLLSAIFFTQSIFFGFIILRAKLIELKLLVYNTILVMFATAFILKKEWIDASYDDFNGWHQEELNNLFWLGFVTVLLFISGFELSVPLYRTLKNSHDNARTNVKIMLICTIIAPASNGLWYFRQQFDIAISVQLLISNITFLVFFHILRKNPFVGFYGPKFINQYKFLLSLDPIGFLEDQPKTLLVDSIHKLNEFKDIMHPIRLSILRHLKTYNSETRVDLLKKLKISSGKFEYHFRVLEKIGFLGSSNMFIDDTQRMVINIHPEGLVLYNQFHKVIRDFLE